jgi:hypothetical protein
MHGPRRGRSITVGGRQPPLAVQPLVGRVRKGRVGLQPLLVDPLRLKTITILYQSSY